MPTESCTLRTSAAVVAVVERPPPRPGPDHPRSGLLVPVVQRRAPHRLVVAPGQHAELDGRPRRPRGGRPDRGCVRRRRLRQQPYRGELAELSLAGAHRHGRVALRELDRVVALRDRPRHVLVGDVLARADEAALAALARVRRGRDRPVRPVAGRSAHRLDPGRELDRDEDAPPGVVLDPGAGLREQGVRGLADARGDDEVAVDRAPVERRPPRPRRRARSPRSAPARCRAGRRRPPDRRRRARAGR